MFEDLGSLFYDHIFNKNDKKEKITKMAKKLGIGPTLFLLSTINLFVLFSFLTIINIPLLIILQKGSGNNIIDIFSTLSYGNIGEKSIACSEINLESLFNISSENLSSN